MTITDWIQAISTVVLVGVTIFYALRTHSMAKEIKEQTISLYKPHVVLEKGLSTKGENFVNTIGVTLINAVGGPAINFEIFIAHSIFKFNSLGPYEVLPKYPSSLPVGEREYREFIVEKDANLHPASVECIPVVINYEDVLGNKWHSVLELVWEATTKDLEVGQLRVAIHGHFTKETKPK